MPSGEVDVTGELAAYYDAAARRVAEEWYPNAILLPTIKDFFSLLPPRPRILDLGCGPGHESLRMVSLGAEVVGVDFSPANIRIARERCPQGEFHALDFRLLDGRFGTFDGIFASASLIHIDPGELPRVAFNLQKVMRADAKLLTLVQDGAGKRERKREVEGKAMRWWSYLYTKEALADLLAPFEFLRDGLIAQELRETNWRCYIWSTPPG
jgi:SAM-dependent methyltransferase